jgi:DnaJ-related protein SCJ1
MVNQQMAPGFVVQMQETCPECSGRGKVVRTPCPHCSGRKVIMEEKTLTADIERGMPSDSEIRFERESEQSPGITPGDVIFKLKQPNHPRFRRDRDDLHHDMHLSLHEALLGYKRTIRHLGAPGAGSCVCVCMRVYATYLLCMPRFISFPRVLQMAET